MIVLFWFGLSVMTLLTAMLIAWPLFVVRHLTKDSDFTLAVYRDQLAEVEQHVASGILHKGQAAEARIEIERRILALDGAHGHQTRRAGMPAVIVAMAVVLPLSALGLYLRIGSPGLAPGQAPIVASAPLSAGTGTIEADIVRILRIPRLNAPPARR
jgi:cytochrome c-type biogenesis protein CcmH